MRVAVIGAGRGSAELIDLFFAGRPDRQAVVLDDRWNELPSGEVCGVPIKGPVDMARNLADDGWRLALGIANSRTPYVRESIFGKVGLAEESWVTLVHEEATVSASATIGAGTIIYPGCRIGVSSAIGRLSTIYYNSVVHHDAKVGDGAILTAGVLLAGNVEVGAGSYLGIGSVVREGVRIGRGALVGMGAVVTSDVEDETVVAGVPAKKIRARAG